VRLARAALHQADDNGLQKAAEIEAAAIPSKPGAADSLRPVFYLAPPPSPYTWNDVYAK